MTRLQAGFTLPSKCPHCTRAWKVTIAPHAEIVFVHELCEATAFCKNNVSSEGIKKFSTNLQIPVWHGCNLVLHLASSQLISALTELKPWLEYFRALTGHQGLGYCLNLRLCRDGILMWPFACLCMSHAHHSDTCSNDTKKLTLFWAVFLFSHIPCISIAGILKPLF